MIIAVAIALVVALTASGLLLMMGNVQMGVVSQVEKANLAFDWWNLAKIESTCSASITKNVPLTPATASAPGFTDIEFNLQDGTPPTILKRDEVLAKYKVKVTANGFRFVIPANTNFRTVGTERHWSGFVELETEKLADSPGGKAMARKIIGSLTIKTDPANQIQGCLAQGGFDYSSLCSTLGGTWNGAICLGLGGGSCPPGLVRIGPNTPADCMGCPANQMLVSNGSGFTCQPYIVCPAGTSKTGLGGAAIPAACKCNLASETWSGASCSSGLVNGVCGPANGNTYPDAATATSAGQCSAGTPSTAISGAGPWSWVCNGAAGGTNSLPCSANQSAGPICPPGASAAGLGILISPGCRCNLASDTWDGITCATYASHCTYSFNNNSQLPAICVEMDPVSAEGGNCAPPYYEDGTMPMKVCNGLPVVACNRCGPGSNIPAGICTMDPACPTAGGTWRKISDLGCTPQRLNLIYDHDCVAETSWLTGVPPCNLGETCVYGEYYGDSTPTCFAGNRVERYECQP